MSLATLLTSRFRLSGFVGLHRYSSYIAVLRFAEKPEHVALGVCFFFFFFCEASLWPAVAFAMDFEICNNGGEATFLQHPEPSPQVLSVSSLSSSASPSSPLSPTAFSSLSATSSSEDLLAAADPLEHLDSFLHDALNSRNRITVLRLELEVERFVRNPKQQQLILNPMSSSYERLAAHRVAQHYHVQSMALDSSVPPSASHLLLVKTLESRVPSVKLADIPVDSRFDSNPTSSPPGKLAIRQRTREGSTGSNDSTASGRMTPIRSVEERMEEYNKARARIFSNGDIGKSDESLALNDATSSGGSERDECEDEFGVKAASPVAVFRDREKDMKDPDYDRSYERYYQAMKVASLNPSTTSGLCSSSSLGSTLITEGGYGQPQRQANYLASDVHGRLWVQTGGLPVLGYPSVLPNAFPQGFYPHYSNVYNCNQEFAYPPHKSFVDWRQDPTKGMPCSSMSSTHRSGWFQSH